jgi:hypothetical protein
MPFVYDDDYLIGTKKPNITIHYEGKTSKFVTQSALDQFDVNLFRENLKKDFDKYLMESNKGLNLLIQSPNDYYFIEYYGKYRPAINEPYEVEEAYYVEVSFNEERLRTGNYFSVRVIKEFTNTYKYIESLMD